VKIDEHTTRSQLAAIVSKVLRTQTSEPVLVGGSVVALYTGELFTSDDLDFVNWRPLREVQRALEPLGFKVRLNTAVHPRARYYVQFVGSPVMVGNKYVPRPSRRKTAAGSFRLLSPLDCVLDRLAWALTRTDAQALEQAAHVAARQRVNLAEVRRWVEREPGPRSENRRVFREFEQRVFELRRKHRNAARKRRKRGFRVGRRRD